MERAAAEVKAVSCRDLALPLALFGKPPVYAVVSLGDGTGRPGRRQTQSTHFDRARGANPEWDQQLRFDLASDGGSPFLEFELVARCGVGGILGDRVVGEARVPLRDLAAEYDAAMDGRGGFRSVGYQVLSPGGRPAGVVNFLYRMTRPLNQEVESTPNVAAPTVTPSPCYYDPPPSSPPPVEQPGAMYYYCCPAPPLYTPTDPYGRPMEGYGFAGMEYVEMWPPTPPSLPPPVAEQWGFPRKGCGLPGELPRDAWGWPGGVDGGYRW